MDNPSCALCGKTMIKGEVLDNKGKWHIAWICRENNYHHWIDRPQNGVTKNRLLPEWRCE
jgi:hypothetical protein